MFASYLAYNFRGLDTRPTLTGFQDDLLYRWAKGDRHLYALASLLSDAACAECSPSLKPYFHPGGVPLDDHSRLQLLIHNWRVANFVNKSSLANGQYGYPPQFGFTPKDNAGAWQSLDGNGSNDVHAIPPEVVARHALAVRETTMVGTRYSAAGSLPMMLHRFGSEYWVVRADSALDIDTTPRDLVVRVSPEGIYHCFNNSLSLFQDFRLMASVVGYAVPAESLSTGQLWAHPEWAVQALDPIWVDVDSVAGGLELVLTGFGTSVNAAVVVISLGDGPSAGWSALDDQNETDGIFPYRLNLALRTAPFQAPNPVELVADALLIDESPTWSPAGDEIAYVCRDPVSGVSGICRKALDGTAPLLLSTTGPESRSEPDWSPRGDWIAFSLQASGSGDAHIWAVHRWTQEQRQLTVGVGHWDGSPAFEPHGQRIAYMRNFPGQQTEPQTLVPGQLRRCNLDGSGDILLADIYPPAQDGSLRWTPDGRFVYFNRDGTLYAVPADGGTPISRPALITGANSFDLHRGQGPLLAEQAGVMTQPLCTPAQPGRPFVRLALLDTVVNDTQARFYRTGAEFYQPRWSPDGTRIAYSSNINSANDPLSPDRDLFIGQVSYNRPPQLAPLPDQVIPAGPTFVLEVQAYDPDGEALTFDAPSRYLPPGASFDPGTHRFTWPNPGPPMSEHFMVFRVMDGSGGVASRAVRIAVTAPAIADLNLDMVGSDLVWLSWTAPGASGGPSAVEYDLRYAPYAITEVNFDYSPRAWDAPAPAAPGTIETHMIGGLLSCTPYWFAIKSKDAGGNWSPLSNVPSTTTMCGPGGGGGELSARAVGPTLAGADPGRAEPAFARPGGADSTQVALAVEMAGTTLAPRWAIHHLPAKEQAELVGEGFTGVVLQAPDAGGIWSERGRLALSGTGWRFGLRAMRRPARLIFLGAYDLQQTWNVIAPGAANATSALALTAARHSRLGDLTSALLGSAGYDAGVGEGDTLSLDYEPTAAAIESAPPWFMVVGPAGSTGDLQGFRGRGVGEGERAPTAFALRQNRPNPFSGTTEIRFELPVTAPVRLEVFDAQGRVVRTLANGSFPVGFHSVVWDERDASGTRVRRGIYFYRIVAGTFRAQRKMTLL